MEGLIGEIAGILSGGTVTLALKIGLLVGVPLVAGLVMWVMHIKAVKEKLEADRKAAADQEKKDSGTTIVDNQGDTSQAKTDQEKSEEDRRQLLEDLKKVKKP